MPDGSCFYRLGYYLDFLNFFNSVNYYCSPSFSREKM